ncbi:MAG: helix-turn-helix transcriptional regulator [Lachnospiraceae bacterium]|nr:helix-turn-helix transcriptional regulator [Lachnospiraceae bacterium]
MAIWNERIHEKRKENGITLAQIAEKLGVTEATAQRYERGNIKSIPYEHMCAYGEILHCSPSYLMGWDAKEHPKTESLKIIQYYEKLNDVGKQEAEKRVEELTHLPRYTLEVMAAHNDYEAEPGELEKMREDLSKLKQPD